MESAAKIRKLFLIKQMWGLKFSWLLVAGCWLLVAGCWLLVCGEENCYCQLLLPTSYRRLFNNPKFGEFQQQLLLPYLWKKNGGLAVWPHAFEADHLASSEFLVLHFHPGLNLTEVIAEG